MQQQPTSVASGPEIGRLKRQISAEIDAHGGWLGFERFMELALYAPGLGYYARGDRQFGHLPASGSDFVTAPELSPLFGRVLARQVAQALDATATDEIWEFGAGSGALAAQLLSALGERVRRYVIVDLSGSLRARQQQTLSAWAGRVHWLDRLPDDGIHGVVVGNELLDAMPVALLHWDGARWFERGVTQGAAGGFVFADQPTALRPPVEGPFLPGTTLELARQASAFVSTLATTLRRGAAFFIDYGFPEAEFFHPQRIGGTLMCHQSHRADADPLMAVGAKDITAHVDFTAIALAAQDAGLDVLGYTSQARFLINCGLVTELQTASLRDRINAQKLINEHEMGELFKVLGLATVAFEAIGFATGDRSHTL